MIPPLRKARRGQPLVALVLILVGWVGVRSALWASSESQFTLRQEQESVLAPGPFPRPRPVGPTAYDAPDQPAAPSPAASREPPLKPRLIVPLSPEKRPMTQIHAGVPPRIAAAHQLLFLAGVSALPVEQDEAAAGASFRGISPSAPQLPPRYASSSRWSADGWVMWRQGGNGYNLPGRGLPGAILYSGAYGASQAGLILRYSLSPQSGHRPALYLRGSSGHDRPRGEELALGMAARPAPRIPVAVMGEVRATRTANSTIYRPALAAVSELPRAEMPLGLMGETYAQAGWVGGKEATVFVDGQARVDKAVATLGTAELRIGAGTWGGAQKGASRLDLGPALRLDLPIGAINTRLGVDYRVRVAGSAAPGTGIAVTFSAGF